MSEQQGLEAQESRNLKKQAEDKKTAKLFGTFTGVFFPPY